MNTTAALAETLQTVPSTGAYDRGLYLVRIGSGKAVHLYQPLSAGLGYTLCGKDADAASAATGASDATCKRCQAARY